MEIHCAFSEMRDIDSLTHHPRNARKHTKAQIDRLAKLLEFYGWRKPVVVSKQSGFIVTGHGKVRSAALNGWKQVPVEYQDFPSIDQELGYLVADNAIAEFEGCETDLSAVNKLMEDLDGQNFNIDMLGLENFGAAPNFEPGDESEQGKLDEKALVECPSCGHKFEK